METSASNNDELDLDFKDQLSSKISSGIKKFTGLLKNSASDDSYSADKRESRLDQLLLRWNEILPNFHSKRHSKSTIRLWHQGVPSRVRGDLWILAIGNKARITPTIFEALRQVPSSKQDDAIILDLDRTFTLLSFFRNEAPLHQPLMHVLKATSYFLPAVGYVQGMSYLAAMFLLYMDEYSAFQSLSNLLCSHYILGFYKMDMKYMHSYFACFDKYLLRDVPIVHCHLVNLGIQPEMYLVEWFLTIFCKVLPIDIASRVWDWYLCDGIVVLFQVSIGILSILSLQLLSLEFDGCMSILTHQLNDINEELLFKKVEKIKIKSSKLPKDYHSYSFPAPLV